MGKTYPSVWAIVAALLPTMYPIAVVGTYNMVASEASNSLGILAVYLEGTVGDCSWRTTVTMLPGKHKKVKITII